MQMEKKRFSSYLLSPLISLVCTIQPEIEVTEVRNDTKDVILLFFKVIH